MDLGQLDKGRELLHRCLLLAPGHSHACVALALGYQRSGDLPRAREYTMQALAADPGNPVALKNLGAILGKEGDSLRALHSTICASPTSAIPRTRRPCTGLARLFAAPGMPAARSTDLVLSRACRFSWFVWPGTGEVGQA